MKSNSPKLFTSVCQQKKKITHGKPLFTRNICKKYITTSWFLRCLIVPECCKPKCFYKKVLGKDLMTYLYISGLLIRQILQKPQTERKHFRCMHILDYVKFRSALTRLCVSALILEVETRRWHKPRAIPYPGRKCIACNKFEDDLHFTLECYLYKDIRKRSIYKYFWNIQIFQSLFSF